MRGDGGVVAVRLVSDPINFLYYEVPLQLMLLVGIAEYLAPPGGLTGQLKMRSSPWPPGYRRRRR